MEIRRGKKVAYQSCYLRERSGSLFCRIPPGIPQKDTGEYRGDRPELLQRYNN